MSNQEELWELVRQIPSGRVTSYGALGQALAHPASGYQVGRWMANAPTDLPWWRVVGKDGRLPIHKRDPMLALEQKQKLEQEGIRLEGEVVPLEAMVYL